MNLVLGAAIDFAGISLPFSVSDLVGSGNALLGLVGTFILLGLAFTFVPKLIILITNTITGYHSYKSYGADAWEGGEKPSKRDLVKRSFRKAKEDAFY